MKKHGGHGHGLEHPGTMRAYNAIVLALFLVALAFLALSSESITGLAVGNNITTANITAQVSLTNNAPQYNIITAEQPILLRANDYQTVFCNYTIYDANGGSDIVAVNATLFNMSAGFHGSADNSSRYINSSCQLNAANGLLRTANCSFQVWYYASPGAWDCIAQANDTAGAITNLSYRTDQLTCTGQTGGIRLEFCVGLSTGPATTMSFGSVAPGGTAVNASLNFTNRCNTLLDNQIEGANFTRSGGSEQILIGNVTYNYSVPPQIAGTNVVSVGNGTFNNTFGLTRQASGTESNRSIWFSFNAPTGYASGTYIGALNFTARRNTSEVFAYTECVPSG